MKLEVERNFLVRTREILDIDPKNFLHCANLMELDEEIKDFVSNRCEHPTHPYLELSEELGCRYDDIFWKNDGVSFYLEWQRLKGLPQEL